MSWFVDTTNRAKTYTDAVLAQLNAEITAHDMTVKSVAIAMGSDYNTFRRYATGERPMPMHVYWSALDVIGIDEEVFIRRARDRFQQR